MFEFLKKAFRDMKEETKAQYDLERANFEAAKAESKANWEEAKMSPKAKREKAKADREAKISAANERRIAAEERIAKAKNQD